MNRSRDLRNHFSDVIDRVEHEHERITVTRNGRPVAVILNPDDLAELEETLSILCDPQALADIREAEAAYAAGDVVRGVDAAQALHPRATALYRINKDRHEVAVLRIEHRRDDYRT